MNRFFALALIFAALFPSRAQAHAFTPGVLEIDANEERWEVLWRAPLPASGDAPGVGLGLAVTPRFPAGCESSPVWSRANERSFHVVCPELPGGAEITLEGLKGLTEVDVVVRWTQGEDFLWTTVLRRGETRFAIPGRGDWKETLGAYIEQGFIHIFEGPDHLLFVFCLLLLVESTRRLVMAITGFTLAHSITLAAAALGGVHLPGAPVEALIALSIVFLAAEAARSGVSNTTLQTRPGTVAFVFGLLHGFGFAGALTELGLPPGRAPLALLGFNMGVELGQLAFVMAAFVPLMMARRILGEVGARRIPGWIAGCIAAIWTGERFHALFALSSGG
jgi:hypothetical protein